MIVDNSKDRLNDSIPAKSVLDSDMQHEFDSTSQLIDSFNHLLEQFLQKKIPPLALLTYSRILTQGLKFDMQQPNYPLVKLSVRDLLEKIFHLNQRLIDKKKLKVQFNSTKALRAEGVVHQIRDVLQLLITSIIEKVEEHDVLIISQKRERTALMLFISLASIQTYEKSYNLSRLSDTNFQNIFSIPSVYLKIVNTFCQHNQLQVFIGTYQQRIIDIRIYLTNKD